jgi:SAM-dependent MidA family methyltransferase
MIEESPIRFEHFMQRALHDPQRGYYARRIAGVGRRGDFTTAPMISDLLARAIAGWVAQAMRETKCRNLIEMGPGEGQLAADVLAHLPWHLRWRTRLHLVETSVPLAAQQRARLGPRTTWHSSPLAAITACSGGAILFSNELVDAFAVRRFQKATLGWQELAISRAPTGGVQESLLAPAALPDSSSFSHPHPLGQWIEVHESYHHSLLQWLPEWKNGRMLTIDYGAQADRLYLRRPRGSIRGYLHHQRVEGNGIYEHPGHQDLTADVNFTDLQRWSQPWVSDQRLSTLSDFAMQWVANRSPSDDSLLDPMGAGGAFLVLDQRPHAIKKP